MNPGLEPGQLLTGVEVGPVAHGGHFVARHEGRVVFVRHALTGELVDVEVTEVSKRFARGNAVTIHRASPNRVTPPCPIAGRCGGCDFQHVDPAHSRELKRQVVAELLGHLAGYEFTGQVADVPPSPLGWRTRMRYHLDANGDPGMRAHRSAEIVALPEGGCRIADPAIADPPSDSEWAGAEVLGVVSADGALLEIAGTDVGTVHERVGDLRFEVAADGFWQAHAAAPRMLVARVLEGLAPQVGETALDLYCGVGLFAGALSAAGATVWGVESDGHAVELARKNVPGARFFIGDVARRFDRLPKSVSLVVLDPPRDGAGAQVMEAVIRRRPRAIAYVACDPAALGRDLKTAAALGYRPTSVTAHDLFPLTHHVECVAILEPDDGPV